MPELATAQLALRPVAASDRARLLAIFRDPYVRRYLWDSQLTSFEHVDPIIAASEASFREHGMGLWCAAERGDESAPTIGFAGLRPMPSGEFELIYGFLPEHWGRGFASECARALMADGFARGLTRIWAGTDLENKASERVMRRLGMRFDRREVVNGLPQVFYVIERDALRFPRLTGSSEEATSMDRSHDAKPRGRQAGVDPYTIPLEAIDVSDSELFETDTHWKYFERLRKEAPVHYCATSDFGPYWSVTRYDDVVHVEKNPEIYSSARSIVVGDPDPSFPLESGFITMDGPKHDAHRQVVQPVAAPRNLAVLEPLIRRRVGEILDSLPVGETFDWVDRVSIELTTGMLATLFDFPYEERRKLTYWSDMATASPRQVGSGDATEEERQAALMQCLSEFQALWKQREGRPPTERLDFITALANSEATRGMDPLEYLGTLILLIVGGNDTTRNSISGGVLALNETPAEYQKLRENRALIPNMVSEIIRWQTPLAYMRRTATQDAELAGKSIAKGDKVLMWYVSANRDEAVFDRPDDFRIDRPNARRHLAFGIGVHFCMGSRLAEMQLRVLWEEVMARFRTVETVGPPRRVRSNFVKGYSRLPVRVHPW